jgi:hypothetical protein
VAHTGVQHTLFGGSQVCGGAINSMGPTMRVVKHCEGLLVWFCITLLERSTQCTVSTSACRLMGFTNMNIEAQHFRHLRRTLGLVTLR